MKCSGLEVQHLYLTRPWISTSLEFRFCQSCLVLLPDQKYHCWSMRNGIMLLIPLLWVKNSFSLLLQHQHWTTDSLCVPKVEQCEQAMLRDKSLCGLCSIYKTIGGERGLKSLNHLVEAIMSELGIITHRFAPSVILRCHISHRLTLCYINPEAFSVLRDAACKSVCTRQLFHTTLKRPP